MPTNARIALLSLTVDAIDWMERQLKHHFKHSGSLSIQKHEWFIVFVNTSMTSVEKRSKFGCRCWCPDGISQQLRLTESEYISCVRLFCQEIKDNTVNYNTRQNCFQKVFKSLKNAWNYQWIRTYNVADTLYLKVFSLQRRRERYMIFYVLVYEEDVFVLCLLWKTIVKMHFKLSEQVVLLFMVPNCSMLSQEALEI